MVLTLFAACQALPLAGMAGVARWHDRYRNCCGLETLVVTGAAVPGLSWASKTPLSNDAPAAGQSWITISPTVATPGYL